MRANLTDRRWLVNRDGGVRAVRQLCIVLLLVQACSRGNAPPDVQIDLLRLFPYTDSGQETGEINLAAPGSDAYLVRGWSQPETLPTGETIVRATGREASVRFSMRRPAERTIQLHCALASPDPHPSRPQPVMVRINGRPLSRLVLHERFEEVALHVGSETLHPGENTLTFVQGRRFRSHDRLGRDAPTLACDWIRTQNTDGSTCVLPHLVRGAGPPPALALPAASHAAYFLRLPEAAVLAFDVATDGGTGARLSVSVQPDNRPQTVMWSGDGAGRSARIDLGSFAGEIVRLDFSADGGGAMQIVDPRIVGHTAVALPDHRERQPGAERPNILLYLIDTLRADHLGAYGYRLPTSPNIDALAADALTFTHALAQASWTRPATGSILTGLYPNGHGAVGLRDGLRPAVPTLADLVRARGYHTAAVVTNVNVGGGFGFDRGFEEFTYLPENEKQPWVHARSDAVNDVVLPWLQAHTEEPFLLYVHVTDPHQPYTPPNRLDERFRNPGLTSPLAGQLQPTRWLLERPDRITPDNLHFLESLYDGEIAFTDQSFGKIVDQLQRLGLYDRTVIVVMADHGEEFHDHGALGHGYTLYTEQLAVPLIVRLPGARHQARRVSCLARQIDVLPTLLDVLDITPPLALAGRSLLTRVDAPCLDPESFAQTSLNEHAERVAVIADGWKWIEAAEAGGHAELFDLATDPGEKRNLADRLPVRAGFGRQAIRQWAAQGALREGVTGPPPTVQAGTMERLRALGYAP